MPGQCPRMIEISSDLRSRTVPLGTRTDSLSERTFTTSGSFSPVMASPGTEHPWLPADSDETFDPLAHADVTPDPETPLVITPRGGAREVGRSCFQVDTEQGRYLVDI